MKKTGSTGTGTENGTGTGTGNGKRRKKRPSPGPRCYQAVNLSHQRRRRRQPQLPPLSPREQMNGRTPGADQSLPKRSSVCPCLPAVHAGAEKPLLLQDLLLAPQGPLLVHPPILVQVPHGLVPDHLLTALTLVALQDTALSQAAGPDHGPSHLHPLLLQHHLHTSHLGRLKGSYYHLLGKVKNL